MKRLVICILFVGCAKSLPAEPVSAAPQAPPISSPSRHVPSDNPVSARFVDITPRGESITLRACEHVMVAIVAGAGRALGETLATGDTLLVTGRGTFEVRGDDSPRAAKGAPVGLAVVATVQPPQCDEPLATELTKKIARAGDAPELTWAGGKMHAHLDLEREASPLAYVGRLRGSAPVAEHTHPTAWEILCAVDARGAFTLNGVPGRLGPREVVVVPPNARHAWQPDPGSELVAIQLYAPPGPEQRFRALAHPDAGTHR